MDYFITVKHVQNMATIIISTSSLRPSASLSGQSYIDDFGDITLPNDHSFFVFGSGSNLTKQIEAILRQPVCEQVPEKTADVFVQ